MLVKTDPVVDRSLEIALEALTRIESIARANSEPLISIANLARGAIDHIHSLLEDARLEADAQRDCEGLGAPE